MEYLLLAYADERAAADLAAGERAAIEAACHDNDQALRQSGHLLAAAGLRGRAGATTVRTSRGQVSVADGPSPAASEQLVGIFFIRARDLNEAIQVAARMPQARLGDIEVRPLGQIST